MSRFITYRFDKVFHFFWWNVLCELAYLLFTLLPTFLFSQTIINEICNRDTSKLEFEFVKKDSFLNIIPKNLGVLLTKPKIYLAKLNNTTSVGILENYVRNRLSNDDYSWLDCNIIYNWCNENIFCIINNGGDFNSSGSETDQLVKQMTQTVSTIKFYKAGKLFRSVNIPNFFTIGKPTFLNISTFKLVSGKYFESIQHVQLNRISKMKNLGEMNFNNLSELVSNIKNFALVGRLDWKIYEADVNLNMFNKCFIEK